MRERAVSVREVLSRRVGAIGLIESRTAPGPATLRHHDAVIGTLRQALLSFTMIAHVSSVVDSYIYGFALQEKGLPFDSAEGLTEVAGVVLDQIPGDDYPHFTEAIAQHAMSPAYGYGDKFEYGLDLTLNAPGRRWMPGQIGTQPAGPMRPAEDSSMPQITGASLRFTLPPAGAHQARASLHMCEASRHSLEQAGDRAQPAACTVARQARNPES